MINIAETIKNASKSIKESGFSVDTVIVVIFSLLIGIICAANFYITYKFYMYLREKFLYRRFKTPDMEYYVLIPYSSYIRQIVVGVIIGVLGWLILLSSAASIPLIVYLLILILKLVEKFVKKNERKRIQGRT